MHLARISIGIVTIRQRLPGLRRLLRSIKAQQYPKESVEITVVPNMDPREWTLLSRALETELTEGVHFAEARERTLGEARNEIIDRSTGEILVFFDDDCWLPDARHLSVRARLHELHTDAVIGGFYLNSPELKSNQLYNEICNTWIENDPQGWKLLGGNVSYPRSLLQRFNARFDDKMSYGGNENFLNLGLWKNKVRFYKTRSVNVYHEDLSNFPAIMKKALLQGRARAHEARGPGSRPPLSEMAALIWRKKRKLSHLSYYFLGEIAYISEALVDRLKQTDVKPQAVSEVVESAKEH